MLGLVLSGCPLMAEEPERRVAGPHVSYEEVASSRAVPVDNQSENTSIEHQRWHVNVLAPLPTRSWGALLVFNWQAFRDTTREEGRESKQVTERTNSAMLTRGVIVPNWRPYGLQLFGVGSGYKGLNYSPGSQAVREYIVGVTDTELLQSVFPTTGGRLSARVLVRLRQYPGRQGVLGVGDLAYQWSSGWYVHGRWPADFVAGYRFPQDRWELYGGHNIDDRIYAVRDGDRNYWLLGYTSSVFGAVRAKLWRVLYLDLRAGIQREEMRTYDHDGHKVREIASDFAPFMRLTLATYIVPKASES